ncbi:hypothetical protein PCNPT3_08370 [Psychromonas sp. CNPT3]|uniref:hypothetical protein n=1 Tax=Psychromonas sp. CNPT3 TaxID=314282 RepID=UPI00006E85E8|nr:hypothetical protein [Psychromonas sp. CNPT3]AGH81612.1 hypothetical protein PCNPT3_08370 [Psychromonas sp. CNPT3]
MPIWKHIINRFGLCLLLITPGVNAMSSKPDLNTLELSFRQNCAGRYQLELPADMRQVKGSFGLPEIGFNVYAPDSNNHDDGVFRGDNRLARWLSYIEAKRTERKSIKAHYVLQDTKGDSPLKTVVYYADIRELMVDKNAMHTYKSFFFKDFPQQNMGLTMSPGLGRGKFERSDSQYKQKFSQQLKVMQGKAEQVHYVPWPHTRLGLCLDDELVFEQAQPSSIERYLVKFYNGKNTRMNIRVRSHSKNSDDYIAKGIKEASGLLSIFASTNMKVAGREGKLFISDGYLPGSSDFRWFSTDTKSDSIRFAHIEIDGDVDINDYPELKGLNGTEVVYGFLKGVTIRPNGMMGVTK